MMILMKKWILKCPKNIGSIPRFSSVQSFDVKEGREDRSESIKRVTFFKAH